jgi:hypothetical protein
MLLQWEKFYKAKGGVNVLLSSAYVKIWEGSVWLYFRPWENHQQLQSVDIQTGFLLNVCLERQTV